MEEFKEWHRHVYAGSPVPQVRGSTPPPWTLAAARKRLAERPITLPKKQKDK